MKKKKIIALLCACILLFSCVYPMEGIVFVKAADIVTTTDSNGVRWEYEVFITGNGSYAKITNVNLPSGTTRVIVPSKLDSYIVKEIGSSYSSDTLFFGNIALVSVSIPSTITDIGSGAFKKCSSLEDVTFASENSKNRVLSIGSSAFSGCTKLKKVKFPEGLEELKIYDEAFDGCELLGISEFSCKTSIGSHAFSKCNFTNVVFKEDVTIRSAAFGQAFQEEDQVRKTIVFEKSVNMAAYQSNAPLAFNPGLTEITFCGDVNLCEGAFANDSNLEKITWGKKLEGIYSSYNTLNGRMVFSGCDKLKTFVFQDFNEDVSVSFKDFYGSFPELDTVIYEGDVNSNYWIDAKNVIFKGYANFLDEQYVSSSKTKNIYCYQWDVDLKNLVAKNVNFYGILPSDKITNDQYKLASYVASQEGCILKNLVSELKVTNVSFTYSLYNKDDKEIILTPADLDLEVTANYADGATISIAQGNGYDGYLFSYDALTAESNNDFTVTYSNAQVDFQVLLAHPKLDCIIAEIKKDQVNTSKQVTVLEGENQLKKDHIMVTAVYEDGTCVDVTEEDSCVILSHTIKVGDGNQVKIKYTDPSTNQIAVCNVQVTGTAKSELGIINAVYKYEQDQNGVLVNTSLNKEQFEVLQLYDNGTTEILEPDQYTINGTVVENLGDNLVVIETKDTKRTVTVNIRGVGLGSLDATYIGVSKHCGDSVTLSDLNLTATYKDGTPVKGDRIQDIDVHIVPDIVTEDVVQNGYANVQVTYANKTAEVLIPVIQSTATAVPTPTMVPLETVMPTLTESPVLSVTESPEEKETATPKPTETAKVPEKSESPVISTVSPLPTETTMATSIASPVPTVQVTESSVPGDGVDVSVTAAPVQNVEAEIEAFENTKPVLSVESLGVRYKLTWKWYGRQDPDKYILYYSNNNEDYKILKTVNGTTSSYTYSNSAALKGTKVYFLILAQKEIGGSTVSSQISAKVGKCLLDPIKKVSISSKNQKLYMSWKKNTKCTGYVVTLTVKYNNKQKSRKIRIASKQNNKLVLTAKQLQKKFGARRGTKITIAKCSVQAYYKSGKIYAYSEK